MIEFAVIILIALTCIGMEWSDNRRGIDRWKD